MEELTIIKRVENTPSTGWKTIKYLFRTTDKKFFESVLIFEETLTLCVSSQIGCPVKCLFCRTGRDKFERNLTYKEITDQVRLVEEDIGKKVECVSYMGMGEPLLNLENVIKSMKLLNKQQYKLSTIGINGKIKELAKANVPLNLYFSLHCAREEKRKELIPFSKNYQLSEVLDEMNEFSKENGGIILWYLMLNNRNDMKNDIEDFISILKKITNIKEVIIKEYCDTDTGFKKSDMERVRMFEEKIKEMGIPCRYSISSGGNINAGCGQLRQNFLLRQNSILGVK